jgi:hypothetical protein
MSSLEIKQTKAIAVELNDDAFARMVAEEVKNKLSPIHKND